ncbi:MAG: hypothetical protein COC01_10015, partial [Bacteroidetes bacterium]
MKKLSILSFILAFSLTTYSNNFDWANSIGGTNYENSYGIAVDNSGNVIITGSFKGTVDFDPGAGDFSLTASASNSDIFFAKYDKSGALIWAKQLGGTSIDNSYAVAVDDTGNIYLTGSFFQTADFDPDTGTSNLVADGATGTDIFFAKYNTNGGYVWAKIITGPNAGDQGQDITVDKNGYVYVVGKCRDTVDFDPGVGVAENVASSFDDIFVAKYDNAGEYIWAKIVGGSNYDAANGVAVDDSGNVFVGGWFQLTVDFDPGVDSVKLTSTGSADIFILKLNSAGNYVWVKTIGGGALDQVTALAMDKDGDIYAVGTAEGGIDFNAGAGTDILNNNGSNDAFVTKYSNAGNYQWAINIGGGSYDYAYGVDVDIRKNVYLIGAHYGTIDMDPGPGTVNYPSVGDYDIFFGKYDSLGNYQWAYSFGNTSTDYGRDIVADDSGYVYATGYFTDTIDFNPGPDTLYLNNLGNTDIFFTRYRDSTLIITCPPNKVAIADTNFVSFLNNNYPNVMCRDSLILDSAEAVTGIFNCSSQGITNLDGIQYFKNITELACYNNSLTSFPPLDSLSALQKLKCYNNSITTLPDLSNNTALTLLWCYMNTLDSLPDLSNNTNLEYLYCYNNILNSLPDLSALTQLKYLSCMVNNIPEIIGLDSNTTLLYFTGNANLLTTVPYLNNKPNLVTLRLDDNQLSKLPELSNLSALQYLYCENNSITRLPDLTGLTSLQYLVCDNNLLTTLPDLSTVSSLTNLRFEFNLLTEFPDLSANTSLLSAVAYSNKFDFSDAKNILIGEAVTGFPLSVTPQNPFGVKDTFNLPEGLNNYTISIDAQDSATSYQWFKDGAKIGGATDTSFSFTNIQLADSGSYYCRSYGTALQSFSIDSFISEPMQVYINELPKMAHIPDTNFRNWISTTYAGFIVGDSLIIDSAVTIENEILIIGASPWKKDLQGLQFFINTDSIRCMFVYPEIVPDLDNIVNLKYVNFKDNGLGISEFPVPNNKELEFIYFAYELFYDVSSLSSFSNLKDLFIITCELSDLPDLSNNVLLNRVYFSGNRLDFSDARELLIIDKIIDTSGTFGYTFLKPFGQKDTAIFVEQDSIILTIADQDSATSYQWFNLDSTKIVGATDTLLVILSAQLSDSGSYFCRSYGTALSNMINGAGIDSFQSEMKYVIINALPLTLQETINNISCNGLNDGSISVSAIGGTAPFTYAWSNGESTDAINGVSTGTYTVTVIDNSAEMAIDSFQITEPLPLDLSRVGSLDNACNGQSQGMATVTAQGGTSPYQYTWSNGSSTDAINGVSTGSYFCTITDANGCTAVTNIVISEPAAIALGAFAINESCPGANDGSAVVTISGGTSPYNFYWDNGDSTDAINGVSTGVYAVTVIDANLCDTTVLITVNLLSSACDSVYPGDCNYNGKVHWNDLFLLGRYFGRSGTARSDQGTVWRGYYADDWGKTTKKGVDLKHLDCNGNGKLNRAD